MPSTSSYDLNKKFVKIRVPKEVAEKLLIVMEAYDLESYSKAIRKLIELAEEMNGPLKEWV